MPRPKLEFVPGSPLDQQVRKIFDDPRCKGKPIPVEWAINVGSDIDTFLWYNLPLFRGYEICQFGLVRSMKNFDRYPYGMLLRYDDKYIYTVSSFNNDRVKISMNELWRHVLDTYSLEFGYPVRTSFCNPWSRNQRLFLETDATEQLANYKCRIIKRSVPTNKKEDTKLPKFTVLTDGIDPFE